jgi:ribonuclease P protein component
VVARHGETAVARNRLRRRLREVWRRDLQSRLPPIDVVIRTRKDAFTAPFAALRGELLGWLERVAK